MRGPRLALVCIVVVEQRLAASHIHCRSCPRIGAITTTVTLDDAFNGPCAFSDRA